MQHVGDSGNNRLGLGRRCKHGGAGAAEFDNDGIRVKMGDEVFDGGGGRVERGRMVRGGDKSYEVGFFEVGRVWIVGFVVCAAGEEG